MMAFSQQRGFCNRLHPFRIPDEYLPFHSQRPTYKAIQDEAVSLV